MLSIGKINLLSKSHNALGSKFPFISNLKNPACASKHDVLELATLGYIMYGLSMKDEPKPAGNLTRQVTNKIYILIFDYVASQPEAQQSGCFVSFYCSIIDRPHGNPESLKKRIIFHCALVGLTVPLA